MVKRNEDEKWFHQWMESIVGELKDQRKELTDQRTDCVHCREEVLNKIQGLDKQIAVQIAKVGTIIAIITFFAALLGEVAVKAILGKMV